MSARTLLFSLTWLAAAIAGPPSWAKPFVIELTVPAVRGYTFPAGSGMPGTQFTASQAVIRVTGDTANVVYRGPNHDGSLYQASSVKIEIPGIGDGDALGSDAQAPLFPRVAVSVGSQSVRIVNPAFPTVFDQGVRASFSLVAGYDMQVSLGPIALSDTYTYHWGPTSGMIPFMLDNGVTGTIAGGDSEGGILKITVGEDAPNPVAVTFANLDAFLKATGANRVATFEEGSGEASGGITFPGGLLQVVQSVAELPNAIARPHAYWFGAMGTPAHFALNATASSLTPTSRFEVAFPEPILAAGFLFNCYQCRTNFLQYGIVWATWDADGNEIEHGTTVFDYVVPTNSPQPSPQFFGFTTAKPFRRLTIARVAYMDGDPWMIDDVRYATTLPAIEYHHAAFDHYFVTSITDELTKLDNGTFAGWTRTGLQFNVGAPGAAGTMPVCRLFSTAFGAKSSHFYSSDAAECELRKVDPYWQFEGTVFSLSSPDASGRCGSGAMPLYRLYNDGRGGAPNHRYTTNVAVRQGLVDAGWISEGAGSLGAIGCVLQ